jgi:hypothetical protein
MTISACTSGELDNTVQLSSKIEQQLLPELLAVLKGAPSEIVCDTERDNIFQVVVGEPFVDDAVVHLVRSIAEAGWLYARQIRPFLQPTLNTLEAGSRRGRNDGLSARESRTRQALRNAFAAELRAYHATLDQAERLLLQGRLSLAGLALLIEPHRCVRLRWLAMISHALLDAAEAETDATRILDLLWKYRNHGDAAVRQLVGRLFSAACAPINMMTLIWVTRGELTDIANEYFIRLDEKGFPVLLANALPILIAQPAAECIFQAGLLRFLYRKWAQPATLELEPPSSTSHAAADAALPTVSIHSLIKRLRRLDHIGQLTSEVPIRSLFLDRYRLLQHLEFHRMYVLLENSDFASHLIEYLEPLLRCRTAAVERSQIVRALIDALAHTGFGRSEPSALSNLQDCLDVYLIQPHTRDQDCITDAFMLTYAFPEPIHYLLRQTHGFSEYLRLFGVAWRLRLAQQELGQMARELGRLYQDLRRWVPKQIFSKTTHDQRSMLEPRMLLATCALFRAHLAQCVHAIIHCLYAETLAPAWRILTAQLNSREEDTSLAALRAALEAYFRTTAAGWFSQDRNNAACTEIGDASRSNANIQLAGTPLGSASQTTGTFKRGPDRRHETRALAPGTGITPSFSAIFVSIRHFIALCQGTCLRLQGRVRSLGYNDPTSTCDDLASVLANLHRHMRQWHRIVWPQWRRTLEVSRSSALRQLANSLPPLPSLVPAAH